MGPGGPQPRKSREEEPNRVGAQESRPGAVGLGQKDQIEQQSEAIKPEGPTREWRPEGHGML